MTHPDSLARRQRFLWRSLMLAVLGLSSLVAAWAWAVGNDFLVVERWPEYRAAVLGLISSYPVLSTVTLFLVHLLLAALALPGASVLMLVVGAGYGTWFGTWLCLTACTAGATLCMLAVRHYLRPTVRRRMGERLAFLDERIARDGKSYLFGLRLLPVVPFAIVNVAAGMSQMKAWSFIWVSYLGMWFGTFVYVNAGSELARIDSIDDFYSPGVVVSLAGLALLPWLLKWMERLVQSWFREAE
jgi:uncharacterized membrane protein YdjX (TVP38/TMEM64 family)